MFGGKRHNGSVGNSRKTFRTYRLFRAAPPSSLSAGKVKRPVFKNEPHVYLGGTGPSQELMMGIGPQPRKQRRREGKKSSDTV